MVVALSRVLKRQPTPEDLRAYFGALLECCPEGRVYIAHEMRSQSEQKRAQIIQLLANGEGIRAIAKRLGVHRRLVREIARVGPAPAFCGPIPIEQCSAIQEAEA